jgi:regulator of sigma E protease
MTLGIILFILVLVVLIVVHEFGHFSVAKLFGIRVDEFGIGFPPRLFGKKIGETLYSVNLLFFGGFVKIFGENPDEAGDSARSFANKSRWVQAAVIAAGIMCNILFAWLALSVGYMVGLPTSKEHVGVGEVRNVSIEIVGVVPGSPAAKASVEPGARLTSIATGASPAHTPSDAADAQSYIREHQEESLVIAVKTSAGEGKTYILKPVAGLSEDKKVIGVQLDDVGVLKLAPHLALVQGAIITATMTYATAIGLFDFFSQIFRGIADFSTVAGPIGITTIGAKAVETGFASVLTLAALISINLALINILPIPGLDGGRLFIIAIEAVIRRKISDRWIGYVSYAGFGLLILLMLVVSYHDILRLIS